ncbi:MAG: hypothetical protein ACW99G_02720 [Candidatus Thorarchaeota archaeon]|jgi:protein associated with RNAse G/E
MGEVLRQIILWIKIWIDELSGKERRKHYRKKLKSIVGLSSEEIEEFVESIECPYEREYILSIIKDLKK